MTVNPATTAETAYCAQSQEAQRQIAAVSLDLRQAQMRMLDMLIYLDETCKKLGIEYQLNSGNVLGAIRHGGFIPWDNDVDVMLDMPNYKKLCDYLLNHPTDQYELQTCDTDPVFFGHWSKLRDLRSEYVKAGIGHNRRRYRGLQIDLFPFEAGSSKILHILACKIHGTLERKVVEKNHVKIARAGYWILRKVLVPIFRIANIFGNKNTYMHTYGMPWHTRYPKDVLFPAKPIEFEGHTFMGPAQPEEYCRLVYGEDYMTLPPPEQRVLPSTVRVW